MAAENKKMFSKAIEIAVKVIMKKHLYLFNNETREQAEVEAIGLRCTGAVALCVKAHWNKELVNRLKKLEIEFDVYQGYVDDVTFVTDELEEG